MKLEWLECLVHCDDVQKAWIHHVGSSSMCQPAVCVLDINSPHSLNDFGSSLEFTETMCFKHETAIFGQGQGISFPSFERRFCHT